MTAPWQPDRSDDEVVLEPLVAMTIPDLGTKILKVINEQVEATREVSHYVERRKMLLVLLIASIVIQLVTSAWMIEITSRNSHVITTAPNSRKAQAAACANSINTVMVNHEVLSDWVSPICADPSVVAYLPAGACGQLHVHEGVVCPARP